MFSFTNLYLDSPPELDSNPNIFSCLMMSELPTAIYSAFDFTLSGYLPSEVYFAFFFIDIGRKKEQVPTKKTLSSGNGT